LKASQKKYNYKLIFKSLFVILILAVLNKGINSEFNFFKWENRPYRPMYADTLEIKFDYMILNEDRMNTTMGGYYPIFSWKEGSSEKYKFKHNLQIGGDCIVFNRLFYKGDLGWDLNSLDPIFGPYADYRLDEFSFTYRFHHISTHLSEGIFENKREKISTLRYSREHSQFLASHDFYFIRYYGGFTHVVHNSTPIELRGDFLFGLQFGLEIYLPRIYFIEPYFAFDFNGKSEIDFHLGKSLVFGLKFSEFQSYNDSSFHILFQYYEGIDPRGNFYNKKTKFYGFGGAFFL
jgi:hypothetical protein